MEYLVKLSRHPEAKEQAKDHLQYSDKKKIIQQNNWAICSFNKNYKKDLERSGDTNEKNYNPRYLEREFANYNNLPTLDFEFTNVRINKIDPSNITICPNYNDDSTEDFDNSVHQVSIRLPLCRNPNQK